MAAVVVSIHQFVRQVSLSEISANLKFDAAEDRFAESLSVFRMYLNEKKEIDPSSMAMIESLLVEMANLTIKLPGNGRARYNTDDKWHQILQMADDYEKTRAQTIEIADPQHESMLTVIRWIRREARRAGVSWKIGFGVPAF